MPIALITGANKGIGFEAVRLLLSAGFTTVLACRSLDRAAAAADRLIAGGASEDKVLVLPAPWDASAPQTFAELFRRDAVTTLLRNAGGLDVVVNNAGVGFFGSAGAEVPLVQQIDETTAVNVASPLALTRALAATGFLNPGCRVINVGSRLGALCNLPGEAIREAFVSCDSSSDDVLALLAGYRRAAEAGTHAAAGWPSQAYPASKAALWALGRTLSRELASHPAQPRFYTCTPGFCKTDMTNHNGMKTAEQGADVIAWLATADATLLTTGGFYGDRRLLDPVTGN